MKKALRKIIGWLVAVCLLAGLIAWTYPPSRQWPKLAAARVLAISGTPRSAMRMGNAWRDYYCNNYDANDTLDKALAWYVKSAEADFTQAKYELGMFYDRAAGHERMKPSGFENMELAEYYVTESARWLLAAAEEGHAEAQFWLGMSHSYEDWQTCNEQTHLAWLQKSANQGFADAQYYLGMGNYGPGYDMETGAREITPESLPLLIKGGGAKARARDVRVGGILYHPGQCGGSGPGTGSRLVQTAQRQHGEIL